jgi:uncharacterized protein (TIGR02118 family)
MVFGTLPRRHTMPAEAVKLTFLFNHPEDPDAFDAYFFEQHLPLNEAVTQLRRREVAKIMGTPDGAPAPYYTPYYMIAEYYFESTDDLQAAFSSEAGQRLNEDLANFAGAGSASSSRRSPAQRAGLFTRLPRRCQRVEKRPDTR